MVCTNDMTSWQCVSVEILAAAPLLQTNNPGDWGVYNTMLNKMGSILEPKKEEWGTTGNNPCHCHST